MEKAQDFNVVASVNIWKKQLVTKEDPGHIHKTLGVLCLASFVVRYAMVGPTDMGFLSHPEFTLPTVLLHFLLTASSFTFKIPKKRISDGHRIWPEYRMHAMVFLCRSLALLLVYWYEMEHNLERNYNINVVVVIGSMLAADLCSRSVGKYRSNSVRDFDTPASVKFFFSTIQFIATSGFLMGYRRFTFPFAAVMVIQLTPFLGTLRRKELIGGSLGAFLYGLFLTYNFIICTFFSPGATRQEIRVANSFGLLAAVWRMAPLPDPVLQNKYVIWLTIAGGMRWARPRIADWDETNTISTMAALIAALVSLGRWKIQHYYKTTN